MYVLKDMFIDVDIYGEIGMDDRTNIFGRFKHVGLISIPRNGDRWMIGPCCFCWVEITKQMHAFHADWVCQERFFQFFPPRKVSFFSNDDRQSLLVCEHFYTSIRFVLFSTHTSQQSYHGSYVHPCCPFNMHLELGSRFMFAYFRICHGGLVLLWVPGLKLDPNGYVNQEHEIQMEWGSQVSDEPNYDYGRWLNRCYNSCCLFASRKQGYLPAT